MYVACGWGTSASALALAQVLLRVVFLCGWDGCDVLGCPRRDHLGEPVGSRREKLWESCKYWSVLTGREVAQGHGLWALRAWWHCLALSGLGCGAAGVSLGPESREDRACPDCPGPPVSRTGCGTLKVLRNHLNK